MWNQQVRYIQRERNIEEPDIHHICIIDLCKVPCDIRDDSFHMVLGMDANDDVQDGSISGALVDIIIAEAVINNNKG